MGLQRVISHLAEQSLLDSIKQLTQLLRNDMLAVKRMALVQIERQVTRNASEVCLSSCCPFYPFGHR
jgi:hypothetical protein